ncbi:DNA-binding transcriptional LysR family regulator [Anaerospora hongkongensis]|uniref:DNA-binding transcriptional LysR family regulator n=1 Tax=Anaerospora hongkongensis TaxID=244830 RepID=A0A4R1Q8W2_9FIRM|nr:LysR family transcriptional regulator [Anaerospora hongkongensis]TCL38841.1 DNA-binding transcriptional LysR family regulator [Anaerospora hongkongensis]
MDEQDWAILLKLYEEKSITKAAEVLFISQPALTARIKQIEDRFAAQIVIRGRKGVHFTPEGKYLVERAREMSQKMHIIEGAIWTMRNEVKGLLRIGASNYFTGHKLPELLRQFQARYPDVEFKVVTNDSRKIVDLIINHDIDVCFVHGKFEWSGMEDLLLEENMFLVSTNEIRVADLPKTTWINYTTSKPIWDMLDTWWKDNFSQPPHVGMEVNTVDSCIRMIMKGLGYGFLPEGVLDYTEKAYKIKMIDRQGEPLKRPTWMFYHEDSLKITLVKTFVDFVKGLDIRSISL